jgi:replicative DNA helicase
MLWRPQDRPDGTDSLRKCKIAKQRNGPTGTVELFFKGQFMQFENAAVYIPAGVEF